jgi:MFS superfamily sulfate permease-like transporter
MAGVVAASMIVFILVFAGGLSRNLPLSALAAVVIVAGLSLFDLASFRWLLRVRPTEFLLSAAALIAVVVFGALCGIVVAVGLSLAEFVRRQWRPYDAMLGPVQGTKGYHDIDRHPEASQIPGLLIYRFDAPIFFANAEHLERRVRAVVKQQRATGGVVNRSSSRPSRSQTSTRPAPRYCAGCSTSCEPRGSTSRLLSSRDRSRTDCDVTGCTSAWATMGSRPPLVSPSTTTCTTPVSNGWIGPTSLAAPLMVQPPAERLAAALRPGIRGSHTHGRTP